MAYTSYWDKYSEWCTLDKLQISSHNKKLVVRIQICEKPWNEVKKIPVIKSNACLLCDCITVV